MRAVPLVCMRPPGCSIVRRCPSRFHPIRIRTSLNAAAAAAKAPRSARQRNRAGWR